MNFTEITIKNNIYQDRRLYSGKFLLHFPRQDLWPGLSLVYSTRQQAFATTCSCYTHFDHQKFTSVLSHLHVKHSHNITLHLFHRKVVFKGFKIISPYFHRKWRTKTKQKHDKSIRHKYFTLSSSQLSSDFARPILRPLFLAVLVLLTSQHKTMTFTSESAVLLILSNQWFLPTARRKLTSVLRTLCYSVKKKQPKKTNRNPQNLTDPESVYFTSLIELKYSLKLLTNFFTSSTLYGKQGHKQNKRLFGSSL